MRETVLMEEMTWPQIRQAIDAGKNVAVLACGAVEQHGPHLPTGTDAYLGTAVAERAARIAANTLVAPTIRPGLSDHHVHFAGTVSLRVETFVALLRDHVESLARHGFQRLVIFPSHGGNIDVMKAHLPYLARMVADRCEVAMPLKPLAGTDRLREFLTGREIRPGRAGAHAGYTETSEMLAFRPDLVDMDAAAPGRSDDDFFLPENVVASQLDSFIRGVHAQAPNGVLGDPTGAAAGDGEVLLQMAAEDLARFLQVPQTPGAARAGQPLRK